jgi:hypothetical protein
VTSFGEQPFTIHFVMDGQQHWHVPDLVLEQRNRPIIREVKYQRDLDKHVLRRTALLTALLSKFGVDYGLATESAVRPEMLANAKAILLRARRPCTMGFTLALVERLRLHGPLRLGDLGWQTTGCPEGSVAREILESRLHVDLAPRLTPNTMVAVSRPIQEAQLWR